MHKTCLQISSRVCGRSLTLASMCFLFTSDIHYLWNGFDFESVILSKLYIFTTNSLPKKLESRIFTKWIGLSDFYHHLPLKHHDQSFRIKMIWGEFNLIGPVLLGDEMNSSRLRRRRCNTCTTTNSGQILSRKDQTLKFGKIFRYI